MTTNFERLKSLTKEEMSDFLAWSFHCTSSVPCRRCAVFKFGLTSFCDKEWLDKEDFCERLDRENEEF